MLQSTTLQKNGQSTLNLMDAQNINFKLVNLCKETQLTSMKPAFLPTLFGNEAQICVGSYTRRQGTRGPLSFLSAHHFGSHFTRISTKGAIMPRK